MLYLPTLESANVTAYTQYTRKHTAIHGDFDLYPDAEVSNRLFVHWLFF